MPASVASSPLTGKIDEQAYSNILESLAEIYDDLQELMRGPGGLLSVEDKRIKVKRKVDHHTSLAGTDSSATPSQTLHEEALTRHSNGSVAEDRHTIVPRDYHSHDNTASAEGIESIGFDISAILTDPSVHEHGGNMTGKRAADSAIDGLRDHEDASPYTPSMTSSIRTESNSLNSTSRTSTSITSNKTPPILHPLKASSHNPESTESSVENTTIAELTSWLSPPSESPSAPPTVTDYRDLIQDHESSTFSDDEIIETVIDYTTPAAPFLAPLTSPLISPVHESRFYPSLLSPTPTTEPDPIPLHVREHTALLPSRASSISKRIKRWREAASRRYSVMSIRTLLTTNDSFFFYDDGLPLEHPRDVWGAPGGDARMAEVERKRCLKDRIRRLAGSRAGSRGSVASTAEWELMELERELARERVRRGEDGLSRVATDGSSGKVLSESPSGDIERPPPLWVPKKAEQVLGSRSRFSPWSSTASLQPRPLSAIRKASKKIARSAAKGLELAVGKPGEGFNIPPEWKPGLDY